MRADLSRRPSHASRRRRLSARFEGAGPPAHVAREADELGADLPETPGERSIAHATVALAGRLQPLVALTRSRCFTIDWQPQTASAADL